MYHSLLAASFLLALAILVYRNRAFFITLLPPSLASRLPAPAAPSGGSFFNRLLPFRSSYTPLPTWSDQLNSGLSSTLFDITANMDDGDSRTGLDESGARDIQTIMREQGVSFDQARLIRHRDILVRNNIDPNTGLPLDSKAVTSLSGRLPGGSRG